jgi:hypothetical protein
LDEYVSYSNSNSAKSDMKVHKGIISPLSNSSYFIYLVAPVTRFKQI